MKIREAIMVAVGTIAVLVFVGFMFDYYLRTEEVQVVKKDMYFDSLILEEQRYLRKKDSLLEIQVKTQDDQIKRTLQYHDAQIKKIREELLKLK